MRMAPDVTPIGRVMLMDMPPLLREILEHAITQHDDLELMREPGRAPREGTQARTHPDAVIVGTTAPEANDHATALLERWPQAQIVVVTAAGRNIALYELRPHKTELGQLSPAEAVQAIRRVVLRRRKVKES
jgi:DNA-binding NarL/FixJ family response regulator